MDGIDILEKSIWLFTPSLIAGFIHRLRILNWIPIKKMYAGASVIGVLGLLLAPSCLCQDSTDKILGSLVFSLLTYFLILAVVVIALTIHYKYTEEP